MNVITRGIRNVFRNPIRALGVIFIIGLSTGLALSLVLSRQAVLNKIASVKTSIGNTLTISPAGIRGFEGGGELLTVDQYTTIKNTEHIVKTSASLQDRLEEDKTSLVSAIDAGSFGTRQGRFFVGNVQADLGGEVRSFTPPMSIFGTDSPQTFTTMGGSTLTLASGDYINGSSETLTAMIGEVLATKNNLTVGSTFTAYDQTFAVTGIFTTDDLFSQNSIVVPLKTLQNVSEQTEGISNITAYADSIDNVDATVTALKSSLGDKADIVSQQDMSKEALAPLENIAVISLYGMIAAAIASGVILLLTMLMIVRERRREIAVLKAIGAADHTIISQFITEALTLTLISLIVSFTLGGLASNQITKALVTNASDSPQTFTTNETIGGSTIASGSNQPGPVMMRGFGRVFLSINSNFQDITTTIGFNFILYGFLFAIGIAVIGSAVPAWLIAKVRPAEVLRNE